jgi:hypothetical protein
MAAPVVAQTAVASVVAAPVVAQPVVAPVAATVAATMGATAGPPTAALNFGLFEVIFPFWISAFVSWLPRGGSSAIYGREAGVALTGMKKQRRDRGW